MMYEQSLTAVFTNCRRDKSFSVLTLKVPCGVLTSNSTMELFQYEYMNIFIFIRMHVHTRCTSTMPIVSHCSIDLRANKDGEEDS